MSNSALLTKAEHSDFGIDKPDAFCNLCLRFFNFMIIFLNGEKDKNEVIGNTQIHLNLPLTLPR